MVHLFRDAIITVRTVSPKMDIIKLPQPLRPQDDGGEGTVALDRLSVAGRG